MAEAGLTKSEMAKELAISYQAVGKWQEGAVPGGELLASLAGLLGVSGHWLLTGEGPMEQPGVQPDARRALRVATLAERERVLQAIRQTLDALEASPATALPSLDEAVREALAPAALKPQRKGQATVRKRSR